MAEKYKFATMQRGEVKGKTGEQVPFEFPRWDNPNKRGEVEALIPQNLAEAIEDIGASDALAFLHAGTKNRAGQTARNMPDEDTRLLAEIQAEFKRGDYSRADKLPEIAARVARKNG